ncbi:hypothetical protein BGW80DRAFT_1256846 [Lactifluus volemus]|nr:hypothetical protein BGW80DRAFT_1256846 [Lactifluus volemus]
MPASAPLQSKLKRLAGTRALKPSAYGQFSHVGFFDIAATVLKPGPGVVWNRANDRGRQQAQSQLLWLTLVLPGIPNCQLTVVENSVVTPSGAFLFLISANYYNQRVTPHQGTNNARGHYVERYGYVSIMAVLCCITTPHPSGELRWIVADPHSVVDYKPTAISRQGKPYLEHLGAGTGTPRLAESPIVVVSRYSFEFEYYEGSFARTSRNSKATSWLRCGAIMDTQFIPDKVGVRLRSLNGRLQHSCLGRLANTPFVAWAYPSQSRIDSAIYGQNCPGLAPDFRCIYLVPKEPEVACKPLCNHSSNRRRHGGERKDPKTTLAGHVRPSIATTEPAIAPTVTREAQSGHPPFVTRSTAPPTRPNHASVHADSRPSPCHTDATGIEWGFRCRTAKGKRSNPGFTGDDPKEFMKNATLRSHGLWNGGGAIEEGTWIHGFLSNVWLFKEIEDNR